MDPTLEAIIQLIILFFVIFDPFVSLAVFVIATQKISKEERNKTATLAVAVAFVLSFLVLFFGQNVLSWLSTTLDDFRVAGGIILALLGIKMATGHSLVESGKLEQGSARAVAAIIGTPLLTGPAAITTIIIATNDYGRMITGAS
jgi:multiple antibiotic resistance protein